jgi:autotransporter-associated beta strand protein
MRFLAAAALLASPAAQAEISTWTGATNTWNTVGNWSGTNTPPLSGDSLVFNAAGAGGLTLNNDLTNAAFIVAGITYNSAAGSYVLGDGTATANAGNAFTLGGNISINTSAAQIINNPITLSGSPVFFVNTGRSITLAGDIDGNTGLNKLQGGLLVLSGTNTYTGVTKLGNFGNLINVLRADDGVGLPATSNLQIDVGVFETAIDLVRPGGSLAGQMRFANQKNDSGFSAHGGPVKFAFGSLATPESLTWQISNFNWGNYALILNYTNANNTLDFKNPVNLNEKTRAVRVDASNPAAIATMSGVLSGATDLSALTKEGAGTLVLTAVNTYPGDTTVTGGTLSITNPYLADTADVYLDGTGIMDLDFDGTDLINQLYLDGFPAEGSGVYDANSHPDYFTGTGSLTVGEVAPDPVITDIAVLPSGDVVITMAAPAAGLTAQRSNDLVIPFADVASTPVGNTLTIDSANVDPDADGADYFRVRN